jgi:hypothetical protein
MTFMAKKPSQLNSPGSSSKPLAVFLGGGGGPPSKSGWVFGKSRFAKIKPT